MTSGRSWSCGEPPAETKTGHLSVSDRSVSLSSCALKPAPPTCRRWQEEMCLHSLRPQWWAAACTFVSNLAPAGGAGSELWRKLAVIISVVKQQRKNKLHKLASHLLWGVLRLVRGLFGLCFLLCSLCDHRYSHVWGFLLSLTKTL